MAGSKDIVSEKYDAIRRRISNGEPIDDAIGAEIRGSTKAPGTLRAAYFRLSREKGDTKPREPKPPFDLEAFRARFDRAVSEREARQRSDFAVLVEHLGDHLRAVVEKHSPAWVRATIKASGVSVPNDEFKAWLGQVVHAATKKQDVSTNTKPAKDDVAQPEPAQGSDHLPETKSTSPTPGDISSGRGTAAPPKPPRPEIRGTQAR